MRSIKPYVKNLKLKIKTLNKAPLPVFSLRLFYQLIMASYDDFVELIPKSGIIEVLITFVEMQSTEQSNQMLQRQLYPLLSLIWEKELVDLFLKSDLKQF